MNIYDVNHVNGDIYEIEAEFFEREDDDWSSTRAAPKSSGWAGSTCRRGEEHVEPAHPRADRGLGNDLALNPN